MAANVQSPPPDQLQQYLAGTLPLEQLSIVESWLETNPHAASLLSTLPRGDAVTRALAAPSTLQPVSSDVLANIVRRVQQAANDPQRTRTRVEPPTLPPNVPSRFGDYRIVREIGRGGMGVVYEAFDEKLHRPAAIKVLGSALLTKVEHRDRFIREARGAAAIRSDHVVTIYQVGEEQGQPYIAMEFLTGSTLEDWLRQQPGPPSLPEIVRIVRELLTGLAAMHDQKLVHRDIKPANIWVEAGSLRIKLLDFGLARFLHTSGVSQPGAIVGTPAYMAPEQGRGKPVDARADLFSVGVVIYRMLTGRSPFQRDDVLSTLAALATVEPVKPENAPAPLWRFTSKLLAKSASARPATAQAALKEWNALAPDLLHQTRSPQRPRWLIATGFAAAAALVFGVIIIFWNKDGKPQMTYVPESKTPQTITVTNSAGETKLEIKTEPTSPTKPGTDPTPAPKPQVIEGTLRVNSRVMVDIQAQTTAVYRINTSGNAAAFVDRGTLGTVLEISNVRDFARVKFDDKSLSEDFWIPLEKLKLVK